MTSYRLLWIEEDYLAAFEAALGAKGYTIERAFFLSNAVACLEKEKYDLILLDVMIPIEEEDVELGFTGANTSGGDRSGLEFFRRYCTRLKTLDVPVLVYTICGDDPKVKQDFVDLGLPPENYVDKVSASNVNDLIAHVERILRHRVPVASRK